MNRPDIEAIRARLTARDGAVAANGWTPVDSSKEIDSMYEELCNDDYMDEIAELFAHASNDLRALLEYVRVLELVARINDFEDTQCYKLLVKIADLEDRLKECGKPHKELTP